MAPTKVAAGNVTTKPVGKILKARKSIKKDDLHHKDKAIIRKSRIRVPNSQQVLKLKKKKKLIKIEHMHETEENVLQMKDGTEENVVQMKDGTEENVVQMKDDTEENVVQMKDGTEENVVQVKDETEENVVEMKDGTEESGVDVPMTVALTNSIQEGRDAFSWLIAPVTPEKFMRSVWEKNLLHIKRTNHPDHFKNLLSTERIDQILKDNCIMFSKNIDITSYKDGERETHNPSGRATPAVVWDFYKKGCSVRLLNPQTFSPDLRKLNSTLQDYFGCFVGANSYLTPPNTQGFAPHYDDIEAFVLQIEGKKHWKIYAPRNADERLPRFSSDNLQQSELDEPVLDVTIKPGDILYFPRGYIHQASTTPEIHSLHITISCYQRNSWGDFFEKLLPAALAVAQDEDIMFRQGLPLNYLSYMGVCHSDTESSDRQNFLVQLRKVFMRLFLHVPTDATADQMGKQFMHDALPPVLTDYETKCSVFSSDNMVIQKDKTVKGIASLSKHTKIKLIRHSVLRLVKEDEDNDSVNVYHYMDNSLEYHGEDPQMFEVTTDEALALEFLIKSYPTFVSVDEIPLDRQESRLDLANLLWRKGLLLTDRPLK